MSTNAPCINCIERNPRCHPKCEKYLEYCKMLQAIHETKRQEYNGEEDFIAVRAKVRRRGND